MYLQKNLYTGNKVLFKLKYDTIWAYLIRIKGVYK